jgi:hypothetical protein
MAEPERVRQDNGKECGLAMLALLVVATLVTLISSSLIGLMTTDRAHAAIQYAVARAFYIAQAGLEEAKARVSAAADPSSYATPVEGVTVSFGSGQFTYWVDPGAGPEVPCGADLETLEAVGQVADLNRTISSRVRGCAVPGTPFLPALFGVPGSSSRARRAPTLRRMGLARPVWEETSARLRRSISPATMSA